jgi:NAD(P)-dependent dehydrogenase (short-subunit alcohol dehydrogenase family)
MSDSAGIRFDGDVAIVTGAAGGIGRAVAVELASRGAAIVAVDFGGDTSGRGADATAAEGVVAELEALGARALAVSTALGSAEAARSVVQRTLDEFGRVDILVNIAGTSLPGPMDVATDDDVETYFQMNLLGTYHLVRAAWPQMRAQKYGRIMNTSSNAAFGIGANAPYGTVKAGMIGLTLDNAIEGRDHGILVNAMMPAAYSRLIASIPNPDYVAWFKEHLPAAKVAAGIAYFLSRESRTTGRVLSVGGGRVARVALGAGQGYFDKEISAESVAEHLDAIEDMSQPEFYDDNSGDLDAIAQNLPAPTSSFRLDESTVSQAGKAG